MAMNVLPWRKPAADVVERDAALSLGDWASMFDVFNFQQSQYTYGTTSEDIGGGYAGLARGAYKGDSIVFACMNLRSSVFSEARFMFRRIRDGRPGDLFGNRDLAILNKPWPGGTTGDLLAKMIQYADLAGNAFVARNGSELVLLRPDWVSILAGSNDEDSTVWDVDAKVLGYVYQEGGPGSGKKQPKFFFPEDVAHFAPIPDPEARYRGMSWLTPVLREISADKAMTEHKISYLSHGATPNLLMKFNVDDLTKYKEFVKQFKADHEGVGNAYKTIFLASGMDATPVGANFKEIDFKSTQGAGETRIAAAAGTPPIIVGLSEGLQGSSLNAGNYQAAKRRFADGTMSYLWRNASGSLARIIPVPADAELWYDQRDIAFLREDQKDSAEIRQADAQTVRTLVEAGYDPRTVIEAVMADDFSRLKHTGLVSVQLQEPGTQQPGDSAPTLVGANSDRAIDAKQIVDDLLASLPQMEG